VLLEPVETIEHKGELVILRIDPLAGQEVVDDIEDVGLGRGREPGQVEKDRPTAAAVKTVGGLHGSRAGPMAGVAAEERKVATGEVGDERRDEPGALHPRPLRDGGRHGPDGKSGEEQVAQMLLDGGGAEAGLGHGFLFSGR